MKTIGKTPYGLRHTMNTCMLDNDVPVHRVAEASGRKTMVTGETFERYFKGSKLRELREAVDKVDYGLRVEVDPGTGVRRLVAVADLGEEQPHAFSRAFRDEVERAVRVAVGEGGAPPAGGAGPAPPQA